MVLAIKQKEKKEEEKKKYECIIPYLHAHKLYDTEIEFTK